MGSALGSNLRNLIIWCFRLQENIKFFGLELSLRMGVAPSLRSFGRPGRLGLEYSGLLGSLGLLSLLGLSGLTKFIPTEWKGVDKNDWKLF